MDGFIHALNRPNAGDLVFTQVRSVYVRTETVYGEHKNRFGIGGRKKEHIPIHENRSCEVARVSKAALSQFLNAWQAESNAIRQQNRDLASRLAEIQGQQAELEKTKQEIHADLYAKKIEVDNEEGELEALKSELSREEEGRSLLEGQLRQKLDQMMHQLKRIELFEERLLNKDKELVDAMLSEYDETSSFSSISSSDLHQMDMK